jgi:hypothetical protein
MFSFFRRKAFHRKALGAILVLGLLAAVPGCDNGSTEDYDFNIWGELPDGLIGTWEFDNDNYYEIDGTSLKYVSIYESVNYGFEGEIKFVSNYDTSSGIIIFKYTSPTDTAKPYSGTYYKELNASSVQLANAYNPDWTPADFATLSEANSKFTKGNVGNYVSMWGNYTKE